MSFVVQAEDPSEVKVLLSFDAGEAVRADVAREDAKSMPLSKSD